jgi:hypothetical protein
VIAARATEASSVSSSVDDKPWRLSSGKVTSPTDCGVLRVRCRATVTDEVEDGCPPRCAVCCCRRVRMLVGRMRAVLLACNPAEVLFTALLLATS